MIENFNNINYLKSSSNRQKEAHTLLSKHKILTQLQNFDPILVGSFPINIDIESSDLDIIFYCPEPDTFASFVSQTFGHHQSYILKKTHHQGLPTIISSFIIDNFKVEIFGQNLPTRKQRAFLHMLVEDRLLKEKGEDFRKQIIKLKKQGYKTEPAFAIALGISGDTYEELLKFS